jgi:hypothetical protein
LSSSSSPNVWPRYVSQDCSTRASLSSALATKYVEENRNSRVVVSCNTGRHPMAELLGCHLSVLAGRWLCGANERRSSFTRTLSRDGPRQAAAGAARTPQRGRRTLAGRNATPDSFRNMLFCNRLTVQITDRVAALPLGYDFVTERQSPRRGFPSSGCPSNARRQADEVLAAGGREVVSAVMASV